MPSEKHAPTKLSRHQRIVENTIAQLVASGFICEHSLKWSATEGEFQLRGNIACQGRLVVWVEKTLELVAEGSDPIVQTIEYTYNVLLQGRGNLFRYDNAHAYVGHLDEHHKHVYDPATFEQTTSPPLWVGEENWPHLNPVGVLRQEALLWDRVEAGEEGESRVGDQGRLLRHPSVPRGNQITAARFVCNRWTSEWRYQARVVDRVTADRFLQSVDLYVKYLLNNL